MRITLSTLFIITAYLSASALRAQVIDESEARVAGFPSQSVYLKTKSSCLRLWQDNARAVNTAAKVKACNGERQCVRAAFGERPARLMALRQSSEWTSQRCDAAIPEIVNMEATLNGTAGISSPTGGRFAVVASAQSCKYIVLEQGASYYLAEPMLCFKPKRGDFGEGNLEGYGSVSLSVGGLSCNMTMQGTVASKAAALEKFVDKCE
jgi:hypothetical protein